MRDGPGAGDACPTQGGVNDSLHDGDIAHGRPVDIGRTRDRTQSHVDCQLHIRSINRPVLIQVTGAEGCLGDERQREEGQRGSQTDARCDRLESSSH